ncbi:MAG: UDP-4-amino-4,6-dideoxy-N-acetyl-beta-L-altrosamine transaminase [Betaproteobacteria bacterium]|nr:UDP-4-amino-4,6-dideoxy-N-acetyl-beta-L-altrosamine transaminase [Betaproteobacteria bacterium]
MKTIPYGRQSISDEDALAVIETLRSDWLTQGPAIECFERVVADYCGAKYAVAVSSATAALHIACLAAGVGPGRSLWTSPNTFVASANCARYCWGEVDFVDIDPQSLNMDVRLLEEKLERAEQQGRLPQVIVPVDFAGQSCEMASIRQLANRYGVTVIEDASHAIGGEYQGRKVGSGLHADMTVFSFHPVKIVTTGEGGMVLTNRHDLYEKLVRLRSHGITRQPEYMQNPSHGDWYYEQIELGYNYRITDIQAALGVSQMRRIDNFIARRREIADEYDRALADLPLVTPWRHPDVMSAWHLYVIQLNNPDLRAAVFKKMREAGILVNVHYIPVHTQPYYRKLGFKTGDFRIAETYYQRAISLPMFPALQADEQAYVVETLRAAIQQET